MFYHAPPLWRRDLISQRPLSFFTHVKHLAAIIVALGFPFWLWSSVLTYHAPRPSYPYYDTQKPVPLGASPCHLKAITEEEDNTDDIADQPIAKSSQNPRVHRASATDHCDLRIQHPEWIESNGEAPMCDFYEARLMELLDILAGKRPNERQQEQSNKDICHALKSPACSCMSITLPAVL